LLLNKVTPDVTKKRRRSTLKGPPGHKVLAKHILLNKNVLGLRSPTVHAQLTKRKNNHAPRGVWHVE